MSSPFDDLSPALVWQHFAALTRIPRCSKYEAAAAHHAITWAAKRGYESAQDALGNVLVLVPATEGHEDAATVVLQGHLDMVCEKDSDSPHDFAIDPIPVVRRGEFIGAQGTTLGSDNGLGLAAAMALADDPEAVHGPLELLMTIDEETGLTGAQGLEPGFVSGKTLLNLDSEEDGALYVGCAGGADTVIELPVERVAPPTDMPAVQLRVHGLRGGHSGLDINTGRANALKLLASFLDQLRNATEFELLSCAGGDKHNAIPREANATLLLSAAGLAASKKVQEAFGKNLVLCCGKTDPDATLSIADAGAGTALSAPLSRASRDALIDLIVAMPHGVLAMSQEVEGLVQTSTNLAVVHLDSTLCRLRLSSRSSIWPELMLVRDTLSALARLAGARAEVHGQYPGWQPDRQSAVLGRGIAVFEQLFGRKPEVKAVHAGLECGIIGEKTGGMDMLSFGPEIQNPHSPSEQVEIASVGRFYAFLKALVAELAV